MKMLILMKMMIMSILMIFINHPMKMGLIILMQTILLCLILGMMNFSYWFSYMLFMAFSGGLLILFLYMSSISANNLFNKNSLKYLFSKIIFLMIFIFFIYFIFNKLNLMNFYFNNEMMNLFKLFITENNLKINISKMYNDQTFLITMILIIYLFISLLSIVKITNLFFGPLRSMI